MRFPAILLLFAEAFLFSPFSLATPILGTLDLAFVRALVESHQDFRDFMLHQVSDLVVPPLSSG
jgi:hypothetical protein